MNESLLSKIKRIRISDIGHLFLFLFALIPAAVYRKHRRHMWLLCEYKMEAQDNAYALFRYLREKQPHIDAVYAIAASAPLRDEVATVGPVVPYGSFLHWIYYLAAEVNISSQKGGKPNAAVCYLFEVVLGWLKNKRVFLQHGVAKDDMPFLHYDKAKLSLFCCSALPEYTFIHNTFGYPEGVVQYLGLCRFDALHDLTPDPDLIILMPTWRMWIQRECKNDCEFKQSLYYTSWNSILNNPELDRLLVKHGKRAVFCVHRNMSQFEAVFSTQSQQISICKWNDLSIPSILKQASVLITDYSSVFMDFAYMKKPTLYYQFDADTFRKEHLPIGYFDYIRDAFGPVVFTEQDVITELKRIILNNNCVENKYLDRINHFFTINDSKNSERTYLAISALLN